jgi:NADH dehydrogenase [ubiquinone] 1 alpha subcomplex assembly factor 5
MQALFDMKLRALRRDRAARSGPELFLLERTLDDCLDRLVLMQRQFARALLIGCPDATWPRRLSAFATEIEVRDPGPLFAQRAGGTVVTEDGWEPRAQSYDLVLAVGTLDTVNDLPLALRLIRHAMRSDSLLMGALAGGDTLPRLRAAMRAADAALGFAAPHAHPRVEAAALAPLLANAGFVNPVVDVDRVLVSYPSFDKLVADLRGMGATNVLTSRPSFVGRAALKAAKDSFAAEQEAGRTSETFEILHFAAWTPETG